MKSKYYVVYYRDFANTYYLVSATADTEHLLPKDAERITRKEAIRMCRGCQKTQNVLLEKKPSECVGQNSKDKSMIVLSLDRVSHIRYVFRPLCCVQRIHTE